ncbi:MAG: hypothetical protein WA081_17500 [Desulfosalsimonadaceae bacterium]
MKINNILINKYLPVENGLYFIAPVEKLEMMSKETDVARSKDFVFYRNGNTYAPLHDKIINHLHNVMQNQNTITITFSYCLPDDYEINDAFKISMNKTECATMIGFYNVFREQILKEKNMAMSE